MIIVPSFSTPTHYRLYRDGQDEALTYVDSLNPIPVHQEAIRWIQLSECQVSGVGEVQFGPRQADLSKIATQHPSARLMPMPWQSGPVYVWMQKVEGERLLALGNTSGYGMHNAVFNGTTTPDAIDKPVAIAAELHCSAQLVQAHLQAGGKVEVVETVLKCLPLGDRAPKLATLADVLLPVLQQLVNLKGLVILAKAEALSIGGLEELRQLVLTEWAHRIVTACEGTSEGTLLSLAMPAAEVSSLKLIQPLNLEIHWAAGDAIPMRVVRVLRAQGHCSRKEIKEKTTEIEIAVEGDWQSFDYVELSLDNTCGHREITLTADKATQRCQLPAGKDIQAIAVAGVRRFGVKVSLETVQVAANRVTVTLVALKEKAFLVKAARSLLQKTGPLQVSLSHPALAEVLVPKEEKLTLCASQGDLAKVSSVYRALIWQNNQREDPFSIAVQPVRGPCIQWTEADVGDEITIPSERLSASI
ncbi:MAG: hypothetical protein AAFQ40_00115 [Cyanobacteria bacterium J06623_5]